MLSRNGSICFTFHTCDKITYEYHMHVPFKNKMRIIRMNRYGSDREHSSSLLDLYSALTPSLG